MNHSTIICTKDKSEILKKTLQIYNHSNYKGEIIKNDIWVLIGRFFGTYQGRFLSNQYPQKSNKLTFFLKIYRKCKQLIINYLLRNKFNLKKSKDYTKFLVFIKKY